jgi:hypothetical protein
MARPTRCASQAALFALCLAAALPARATMLDDPPPARRLVLNGFTALRGNPLGFSVEGEFALRQRLYADDAMALRDNYLAVGVRGAISPATARIGLLAQVQPLTVLNLHAAVDGISYFGNFDNLRSFKSASAAWGDAALDASKLLPEGDPSRAYAATGLQVTLGARLQLKVGNVAVSNTSDFIRTQASLHDGDRVFLDPVQAALVPQKAFLFVDDLDAVWVGGAGLIAGLRMSVLHPFFGARHFAPGEAQEADAAQLRLGPVFVYRFYKEDGRVFNAPTVAVLVNWYVQHKYRTGAEVSQAIPYVAVGFGFFGDLLEVRR